MKIQNVKTNPAFSARYYKQRLFSRETLETFKNFYNNSPDKIPKSKISRFFKALGETLHNKSVWNDFEQRQRFRSNFHAG